MKVGSSLLVDEMFHTNTPGNPLEVPVQKSSIHYRGDEGTNAERYVCQSNLQGVEAVDLRKELRSRGCYTVECSIYNTVVEQKQSHIFFQTYSQGFEWIWEF